MAWQKTVDKKELLEPDFDSRLSRWSMPACWRETLANSNWSMSATIQSSQHPSIGFVFLCLSTNTHLSLSSSVKSCEGETGSDPTQVGWSQVLWKVKLQHKKVKSLFWVKLPTNYLAGKQPGMKSYLILMWPGQESPISRSGYKIYNFKNSIRFKVSLRGMQASVMDLYLHGNLRIVFKPLLQRLPLVGGMQVTIAFKI